MKGRSPSFVRDDDRSGIFVQEFGLQVGYGLVVACPGCGADRVPTVITEPNTSLRHASSHQGSAAFPTPLAITKDEKIVILNEVKNLVLPQLTLMNSLARSFGALRMTKIRQIAVPCFAGTGGTM